MGPPFENGGGTDLNRYGQDVLRTASMGPPFENGGGLPSELEGSLRAGASMGPPFENGGGSTSINLSVIPTARFNGAAVRKRRRAGHGYGRGLGLQASMGPPFENGGGTRASF